MDTHPHYFRTTFVLFTKNSSHPGGGILKKKVLFAALFFFFFVKHVPVSRTLQGDCPELYRD
jgi:hypothetical protein